MREQDIPWSELAFETMKRSLRYYFDDRAAGRFKFRSEHIHGTRKPKDATEGWIS